MNSQILKDNRIMSRSKEFVKGLKQFQMVCENIETYISDLVHVSTKTYEAFNPIEFLEKINFEISTFYELHKHIIEHGIFQKVKHIKIDIEEAAEVSTGKYLIYRII